MQVNSEAEGLCPQPGRLHTLTIGPYYIVDAPYPVGARGAISIRARQQVYTGSTRPSLLFST